MLFNKRFLQVVAAGLLLLFPASLFAAAVQISGNALAKGNAVAAQAIDTLTAGDSGLFGNAAVNLAQIIFATDSLNSPTATRDRIVSEGRQQLDCKFFRIQALGTDRFQINATGGRTIVSIKLNGTEIPTVGGITSNAGQLFKRDDSNQNAPIPACPIVPSLSFYGLIALALALAGFVAWMFRRRKILKTG